MKMKDSMDQMEFDRGNPQEDAPRRVQKRKKLNWKPVWFAVAAAVLAAVLLVASLTDTTAFDGLRRSITYARAKKDETGCAQLYHYAADRTSCFASLDGSLAIVTNSQLLVMQENGQVVCNETVKWTSCTVAQNQGIAAAYDIGGTDVYVLNAHALSAGSPAAARFCPSPSPKRAAWPSPSTSGGIRPRWRCTTRMA